MERTPLDASGRTAHDGAIPELWAHAGGSAARPTVPPARLVQSTDCVIGRTILKEEHREVLTAQGPDNCPVMIVRADDPEEIDRVAREAGLLDELADAGATAFPRVLSRACTEYVREDAPARRTASGRRRAEAPSPGTQERLALAEAREQLDFSLALLHERGWALGLEDDAGLGVREDGTLLIRDLSRLRPDARLRDRLGDQHWIDTVLGDGDRTLHRPVPATEATPTGAGGIPPAGDREGARAVPPSGPSVQVTVSPASTPRGPASFSPLDGLGMTMAEEDGAAPARPALRMIRSGQPMADTFAQRFTGMADAAAAPALWPLSAPPRTPADTPAGRPERAAEVEGGADGALGTSDAGPHADPYLGPADGTGGAEEAGHSPLVGALTPSREHGRRRAAGGSRAAESRRTSRARRAGSMRSSSAGAWLSAGRGALWGRGEGWRFGRRRPLAVLAGAGILGATALAIMLLGHGADPSPAASAAPGAAATPTTTAPGQPVAPDEGKNGDGAVAAGIPADPAGLVSDLASARREHLVGGAEDAATERGSTARALDDRLATAYRDISVSGWRTDVQSASVVSSDTAEGTLRIRARITESARTLRYADGRTRSVPASPPHDVELTLVVQDGRWVIREIRGL